MLLVAILRHLTSADVLEYREITKLRTAFLEPYVEKAVLTGDGANRLFSQWHSELSQGIFSSMVF